MFIDTQEEGDMFKPTVDFEWDEQFAIMKKYRLNSSDCKCSSSAKEWYDKGISYNKIGEKYGTHDYHYFFYNNSQHCKLDMEKQREYFLKSIECFRHAAEEGHDIAMMIYGLYIYHCCHKEKRPEAFRWFMKASECGLALADYAVSCCYYHGYGIKRNQIRSKFFFQQFKKRWSSSLRQRALALHIVFNMELPFEGTLYVWCSGGSYVGATDLPGYLPIKWMTDSKKLAEPNFCISSDTDVMEGVPSEDYFMEYYYM